MPTFRITSPDGRTFDVTGPDGSTPDQALAQVQARHAQQQAAAPSPLGGDWENHKAGIGQGMMSLARGAGQLARMMGPGYAYSADALGLPGDQATIDEAKRLDAPLLKTKAGFAGSILGQAVPAVLTAPVAGAGVVGGALTGAALGAAQPIATGDSRTESALIGAAGGALAPILGRAVSAGYGAAKGLIEPFTEGGRNAIAGRTLQRFGIQPGDVQGLSGSPTLTGARTMLAEQIQRPEGAAGAARLQDALRSLDPEIAGKITAREAENNAARLSTLQELAGQGGARDFAAANRAGTSGPMYKEAFGVDASSAFTPALQREMQTLMRSPAIKQAQKDAAANASNAGTNVGKANGSGSVEGLHNMKLALDAQITAAKNPQNAAGAATLDGLQAARDRLVGFIEKLSPEYANARQTHALMSQPLNQMDVAGGLLRAGTSATTDVAGNARLMPQGLLSAVRDETAERSLVKKSTGRPLGLLSDVLDPDQLAKVRAVTGEVDRAAAVGRAGNGPGSATAQRLASTNLLHQIGLPQNMTDNALVQTLMRPVQFGAAVAEPRIQQQLLKIMQDPSLAAEALKRATPAQRIELQRLISNASLAQGVRSTVPAGLLGAWNGGQ